MIYYPIKHGLVTFQGLADGTVSMRTFFAAKKQAEFIEWVESKTQESQQKDEVEYFD